MDANIVTNNKFYLSPVAQAQEIINTNTIDLQKNLEMNSFIEKQLHKQLQLKERYKSTITKQNSTFDDNVMISKK